MDNYLWQRKSRSWIIRFKIVEEDYYSDKDLSWARIDSCKYVRWYAAAEDYNNGKDLSWAETDPCYRVRSWTTMHKLLVQR